MLKTTYPSAVSNGTDFIFFFIFFISIWTAVSKLPKSMSHYNENESSVASRRSAVQSPLSILSSLFLS